MAKEVELRGENDAFGALLNIYFFIYTQHNKGIPIKDINAKKVVKYGKIKNALVILKQKLQQDIKLAQILNTDTKYAMSLVQDIDTIEKITPNIHPKSNLLFYLGQKAKAAYTLDTTCGQQYIKRFQEAFDKIDQFLKNYMPQKYAGCTIKSYVADQLITFLNELETICKNEIIAKSLLTINQFDCVVETLNNIEAIKVFSKIFKTPTSQNTYQYLQNELLKSSMPDKVAKAALPITNSKPLESQELQSELPKKEQSSTVTANVSLEANIKQLESQNITATGNLDTTTSTTLQQAVDECEEEYELIPPEEVSPEEASPEEASSYSDTNFTLQAESLRVDYFSAIVGDIPASIVGDKPDH